MLAEWGVHRERTDEGLKRFDHRQRLDPYLLRGCGVKFRTCKDSRKQAAGEHATPSILRKQVMRKGFQKAG